VRKELRHWLRHIHDKTGITTVFVTHDQEEAMELADLVAILHQGSVEQIGTPTEIRGAPVSEFVADFIDGIGRPATVEQVIPFPESRAIPSGQGRAARLQ
jgi:sulfate transport system ATP-binding protein